MTIGKEYNADKYYHFRNQETGKYDTEKMSTSKTGKRVKPIMEKIKVPFGEVRDMKLDAVGSPVPTLETEDFTIINNYLVDFWGAIMGDSVVSTYMHLKRYAYGKKDYCYIDIEMIALKMGKSKNAVKGYLDTLEEYGFIAIFWRRDKETNREVSPLFKIRRMIPLITQEMYDSLKPKLKELHDEYMSQYEGIKLNTTLPSTSEVINDMVANGSKLKGKINGIEIEQVVKEGNVADYIIENDLTHTQREENNAILSSLMNKISKPSFDTWFKNTIFVRYEDSRLKVISSNTFSKDWIERQYIDMITEVAVEELFMDRNLDINVTTLDEYVSKQRIG